MRTFGIAFVFACCSWFGASAEAATPVEVGQQLDVLMEEGIQQLENRQVVEFVSRFTPPDDLKSVTNRVHINAIASSFVGERGQYFIKAFKANKIKVPELTADGKVASYKWQSESGAKYTLSFVQLDGRWYLYGDQARVTGRNIPKALHIPPGEGTPNIRDLKLPGIVGERVYGTMEVEFRSSLDLNGMRDELQRDLAAQGWQLQGRVSESGGHAHFQLQRQDAVLRVHIQDQPKGEAKTLVRLSGSHLDWRNPELEARNVETAAKEAERKAASIAKASPVEAAVRQELDTTFDEGVRLIEAKEDVSFLQRFMHPLDLRTYTAKTTIEQLAKTFREGRAAHYLEGFQAIKGKEPEIFENGTMAGYEWKSAAGERERLMFVRYNGLWYLHGGRTGAKGNNAAAPEGGTATPKPVGLKPATPDEPSVGLPPNVYELPLPRSIGEPKYNVRRQQIELEMTTTPKVSAAAFERVLAPKGWKLMEARVEGQYGHAKFVRQSSTLTVRFSAGKGKPNGCSVEITGSGVDWSPK